MSYVTILWSIAAAGALLLGAVHGLVWLHDWMHDRRARANLAFAIASFGLAGYAVVELGMMYSRTPQEWGEWLWWAHIPLFVFASALAVFLRLYLGVGRLWLLGALIATRAVILILNFSAEPNFNFRRVEEIEQIPLLGEQVTVVASAATGDGQWLGLLATLLFLAFLIDIFVTLWRLGTAESRRLALVVAAPVLLAMTISGALTQAVIWRLAEAPLLLVPPYLISLGAMALELTRDLLRASRLARDLRESEQRLELAASAAGAGLWAWNGETGRVWATARARTILDLDETGDIDTLDLLRVVDPRDAPALEATMRDALTSGGGHALQFRVVDRSGRTRWIAAQGALELSRTGKVVRARGVVRDVTHEHEAEEEAEDLRRKLAHAGRVTMMGQLSSALAHELGQPLGAIRHNAEAAAILLAKTPLDVEELRAIIGDIVRDDQRASDVMQRLRTFLKRGRMHLEAIAVEELVSDVVALLRSEAAAKQTVLEYATPSGLPPIAGDRVHLSQVLLNLTMNALDAAGEGGRAQRRVIIEAHVGAGNCCEVSVSDSGPGIQPDRLEQIFEPFVTAKTEGMGIGLSISRTIVDAHGGRLWAENVAGGGATFRFTVPLHEAQLQQRA